MSNLHFIGRNIIELNSVDSTNNFAKNLLSESKQPEGTVIAAKEQFAGRGQQGNTWQTEPGKNLTISIILYPHFLDASKQFFLNMAVALAVKDFCEFKLREDIRIKWPNDIYYRDKKLGGILIENSISGQHISHSVIGIGLNINQVEFDEDLPNPASFAQISLARYSMDDLIPELCQFMEKYYLQLRHLHFNFLDKAYTESLYRYQQTHAFKRGERLIKGEINGVTKEGKLIIHSNSKELKFGFKEVEYVI